MHKLTKNKIACLNLYSNLHKIKYTWLKFKTKMYQQYLNLI